LTSKNLVDVFENSKIRYRSILSIGELAIIVIIFEFGRSYRPELIEYCPPLRGEEAENLVIVLFNE